jgi:hypothetical protein
MTLWTQLLQAIFHSKGTLQSSHPYFLALCMYHYQTGVVIVDKLHWIFVVRADKTKPLFTPKV